MSQDNPKSEDDKKQRFRLALWSAAGLYLWSLLAIWVGPAVGMSGWTFYAVGVLPAVVGVYALSMALGLYMDLRKQ
jgi:hypothetical protein